MDFKINTKTLGQAFSKMLAVKNLVSREDEKTVHLQTIRNELHLEVIKNQQFQFSLIVEIENQKPNEINDCYLPFYQLDFLKPLLSLNETVQIFQIANVLNVKSQSKGALTLEIYNNQEAHKDMKLWNCPIEANTEIPEWKWITSKLNTSNDSFNIEITRETGYAQISSNFDTSSFFIIRTEVNNIEKDINVNLPIYSLNLLKNLEDIRFNFDENEKLFIAKGSNGALIIKPLEVTNEELEIIKDLILMKEDLSICTVDIPQNLVSSSIKWQQFKLTDYDSLSLSSSSETFNILGSHCDSAAEINCIALGEFRNTSVNHQILDKAINLFQTNNNQILRLYQCLLEIENEEEPTIFFITEGDITPNTVITAIYYSTVDQT